MSKKSRIIQGIISITIGMLLCYFYLVPMTTELAKDETINEASRVLISIMPIIYILVVIVGAMSIMFATNYIVTYLKWRAFGNRLKAAYTAKFGGENIEIPVPFLKNIQSRFFTFRLTFLNLLCIVVAGYVTFLYLKTKNWMFNNILAISF